ncbi:peptidase inhibitor 16 [Nephila pilipes]|uniref:Peptidase inhibitor 16 n=1 Tax=Nephila pilipes TaxID=299642 RepID=A0A8X6PCI3_NEPPI|nr:peptidase inhibitor 16 [Nephila pilipes]
MKFIIVLFVLVFFITFFTVMTEARRDLKTDGRTIASSDAEENIQNEEWDKKLEYLAQLWADGCIWEHGKPKNTSYKPGLYGQNLYRGSDPTGFRAVYLWYIEYHDYNMRTKYCIPDRKCGHYVQLAWATSNKVGCAIRECGGRYRYYIVCHYFHPVRPQLKMYEVGTPCSQCRLEDKALCLHNLCSEATCNLTCLNCGKLDETSCKCNCADGWDSPDCSKICEDAHEKCGVNPGFPNKDTCSMNKNAVRNRYCRKMCRSCNPSDPKKTYSHVCCGGLLCEKGHVLNTDSLSSIICALKISMRTGHLRVSKESKDNLDGKLQNSKYPEGNSLYNYQLLGNDANVGDNELIESESLIEKLSKEEPMRSKTDKRQILERGFTDELKTQMLDLHNLYRSNVTPPAANMAFMEWDNHLEILAQKWADRCVFEHGTPPGTHFSEGYYGQNLYLGSEPTGYQAAYMWYEEYQHYNLKTRYCKPYEQCGHYVQLAWATCKRLGCGVKRCDQVYLIVCHYFPGTMSGVQMYEIGRPCSLCPKEEKAKCMNNLCNTASCNLYCHNCGRLNSYTCQCQCADGWDGPDCSRPCEDEHERCHVSPGFPDEESCSLNNYDVANKYCRKMCYSCAAYSEEKTYSHVCCGGKTCSKGYVLEAENNTCACNALCPGPSCG